MIDHASPVAEAGNCHRIAIAVDELDVATRWFDDVLGATLMPVQQQAGGAVDAEHDGGLLTIMWLLNVPIVLLGSTDANGTIGRYLGTQWAKRPVAGLGDPRHVEDREPVARRWLHHRRHRHPGTALLRPSETDARAVARVHRRQVAGRPSTRRAATVAPRRVACRVSGSGDGRRRRPERGRRLPALRVRRGGDLAIAPGFG